MANLNQISLPSEGESKVDLFRKREIRKVLHGKEWWFSVKDVLEALTDTTDGNRYSRDLRAKDPGLKSTWAEITRTLNFDTGTRGKQPTMFIGIEGIFRLMQSVPTAKAEPFKKWLAKVGFERLQEINDPELAVKRAITLYRAKGYDDEWIDARITNKSSRELLTSEWDKRGVAKYIGLLTDAISVETFGIGVREHKRLKGLNLKSHNLRDNMTPIELTLTTLGEQATTEIVKSTNPSSLEQHKQAAEKGGGIAGVARRQIEEATSKKVVSSTNYLTEKQRMNNAKTIGPGVNKMIQNILDSSSGTRSNTNITLDAIIEIPVGTTQSQLMELNNLLKKSAGEKRIAVHLPSGKLISLNYGVRYDVSLTVEIKRILKSN